MSDIPEATLTPPPLPPRLPPPHPHADYHAILPNLIVGTQPSTPEDLDRLFDVEGVTCMFDTQMDKDKAGPSRCCCCRSAA